MSEVHLQAVYQRWQQCSSECDVYIQQIDSVQRAMY